MRDFENSGRSVAASRNGMAATSHPAATLTAVDILRAGGRAIDAAVAACAVQCVVEAGSTGIGGDCFALLAFDGRAKVTAYNGSGRTPAAATFDWYERAGITSIERSTPHAVTIPGAIEAWSRLINDHGRLSLAEVLAPAIELARSGYAITPRVAFDIATEFDLLRADPTTARTFLGENQVPEVGTVQHQYALADTMEQVGAEGPSAFYRGDIAQEMVEFLRERGGLHTIDDFAGSEGNYVEPITSTYRGMIVHECPPNGQGIIALLIMNILERLPLHKGQPDHPDNLRMEVEATRLAYSVRDAFLGDPANGPIPESVILSDKFADDLAARINTVAPAVDTPVWDAIEHRDTVYISVVDKDRNAVSFINSIFHSYGSALMTPKSGVLFHSRGQSFSLKKGHPNAIAARRRPMHTIIPGMVTNGDRVVMPFGVMGGHYQAMGQASFLTRFLHHGMDIQGAIEAPRLFPLPGTRTIEMEHRLRGVVSKDFEDKGFTVTPPAHAIGGAQAIWIDWTNGTLIGGSDPRKDGCALGY